MYDGLFLFWIELQRAAPSQRHNIKTARPP
jgi:hypothetical protein